MRRNWRMEDIVEARIERVRINGNALGASQTLLATASLQARLPLHRVLLLQRVVP